jgi:hypothetical protein
MVREKTSKKPLPRVEPLTAEQRLKLEMDNVGRCIDYARERLGL